MKEMTIEEIKACSIGILNFIDKVCVENQLKYFLCGGTLLGAIRHSGFIPWDDDIDIMMPREDYERLIKVWSNNSDYKLLNYKNTHNFPYPYIKVIDSRTLKIEPIRKSCQHLGVDVDVFPIDNIPDDYCETIRFFDDIAKYQSLLNRHTLPLGKGRCFYRTIIRNVLILLYRILELFGINTIDQIVSDFSKCAQRYNEIESKFCGITAISHYGIKEKNPKENYEKMINVMFEGRNYPAPIGFVCYLTQLYGNNYMQFPPIHQQKSHHLYKAYWK